MVQCGALCCSVLQHVAACCSMWQHVSVQCVAVWSVLYRTHLRRHSPILSHSFVLSLSFNIFLSLSLYTYISPSHKQAHTHNFTRCLYYSLPLSIYIHICIHAHAECRSLRDYGTDTLRHNATHSNTLQHTATTHTYMYAQKLHDCRTNQLIQMISICVYIHKHTCTNRPCTTTAQTD